MNRFPEYIIVAVLLVVFGLAGAIVRSAAFEPTTVFSAPTTRPTIIQETDPKQAYVGSNACFPCHRAQGDSWSETNHAKAFEHLPEKYRADSSCLKCHVTAFGETSGFAADMDGEAAKPFLSVGCESCHGPGAAHVAGVERWTTADPADEEKLLKEMRAAIVKTPTDNQCAVCHEGQSHHGAHPTYEGQPVRSASVHGSNQKTASAAASPSSLPNTYSVKTCGSCHYEQYKTWLTDKHVELSTSLPAKYENDETCLKCHRKSGEPSDWFAANTDLQADAILLGVGCESCHGSAAKHVAFNKQFISGPQLTPEIRESARESMRKDKLTCLQCHIRDGHKQHVDYDKPDTAKAK